MKAILPYPGFYETTEISKSFLPQVDGESRKLRPTQPVKKIVKVSQDGNGMEYPKIWIMENDSLLCPWTHHGKETI